MLSGRVPFQADSAVGFLLKHVTEEPKPIRQFEPSANISEEMERIIMKNGTAIDLADQAEREGIRDLRQSGLLKVKKGQTSLEEVEGVTNE
jgi:hypothetical protein